METVTRIIFMGTPDFAVPSLRALSEVRTHPAWQLVAVVTQPDRRSGRGRKTRPSPIKSLATELSLPVLQPGRLRREPESIEALAQLAPDLIVVAAYGQILPRSVLEIPRFGCINVHASLLPAYRGASPITAALLDGLSATGVSIMLMDEGMDTGPVLSQARQPIESGDTALSLSERLARQGSQLLVETLPRWLRGDVAPRSQSEIEGEPSTCSLVKKGDGRIDWQSDSAHIERMTRAFTPWPSAFTQRQGETFKIIEAKSIPGMAEPGQVVAYNGGAAVGTGSGLLRLVRVQPAGKRGMDIQSYLNGTPELIGETLGEE